jgi:hypothetical protein
MEDLNEYAEMTTDKVKKAVKDAGNTVKQSINASAPVRTGKYAKSWRVKNTKETSQSLEVTVFSPTRYMLSHLLENGHAKRGGGRVEGKPHIKPAEEKGKEQLVEDIKHALSQS